MKPLISQCSLLALFSFFLIGRLDAQTCNDPNAHNTGEMAPCETCFDFVQNGDEEGIDCGGANPFCVPCPLDFKLDVDGRARIHGSLELIQSPGDSSLFIGLNAGLIDDGGVINGNSGNFNTFIGTNTGKANVFGENNTFLGMNAGLVNNASANGFGGEGDNNTFLGASAGLDNTFGGSNTYVGAFAGLSNTTGTSNTFLGISAGVNNLGGGANTFVGGNAGSFNTTGGDNTFVGGSSGNFNNSGRSNTFVGHITGLSNATGNYNTLLGTGANVGSSNLTNATAIGANARVNESNSLILGSNANVGIGTSSPSEKLEVDGNIYASDGDLYSGASNGVINCGGGIMTANSNYIGDSYITPTFATEDQDLYIAENIELGSSGNAYKPGGGSWLAASDSRLKRNVKPYSDGLSQILQINPVYFKYNNKTNFSNLDREYIGVLAQDMLNIAPYTVEKKPMWQEVKEDENGKEIITKAGKDYYTFDPGALTYMLINAVKEQQAQIEALQAQNDNLQVQKAAYNELKAQNEVLQARLQQIETAIKKINQE